MLFRCIGGETDDADVPEMFRITYAVLKEFIKNFIFRYEVIAEKLSRIGNDPEIEKVCSPRRYYKKNGILVVTIMYTFPTFLCTGLVKSME